MAGEWIAVDLALDQKPEVQELIDTTGEPVETVCFRLWKLWGWASMHCADGTARMTLPRLVRTCGGNEAFWLAVAAVGWLEIDETAATVAVPGWDRRFSQAAKARLQHADRSRAYEDRNPGRKAGVGPPGARAPDDPALTRRRGEENRISSSSAREASLEAGQAWRRLRLAWNTGASTDSRRRAWKPAEAPVGSEAVIEADGWLDAALEAIPRLAGCRYFDSPVTMTQFLLPGFVQKVLGGQYDSPKTQAKAARTAGDADRPPPRVDPAFEAARKATEEREAARREAEHRRLDAAADGDDLENVKRTVVAKLRQVAK